MENRITETETEMSREEQTKAFLEERDYRRRKYSLERSFGQFKKQTEELKSELMEAMGITTPAAWLNRLRGYAIPNLEEEEKINAIFAKRGITENIWGMAAETEEVESNNTL